MGYSTTINGLKYPKLTILADQMSEEEFFYFCQQNPNLRIEREADKKITIMDPIGNESGYYEMEVSSEIRNWAKTDKTGIAFSSATGFTMPTGAVKSPDASWLPLDKWLQLPAADRKKFTHVCPDFVAEVRSESDNLDDLRAKMHEWIENGVKLGWLIDPKTKTSYIYRADGSTDIVEGFDKKLSGEDVLKGFELDLSLLILPE
ncbi:MAG: Uma2 family endonuclease [Saprospiraceae bacterium]|nr:Uma2 family endonuclease [Saprospiraceae bacterium]